MIDNPIFIIGTERSGSNLLRLLLNSHSNIAIPHPPHLMRDFHRFEIGYGDLDINVHFSDLIEDCIEFVNSHFAPWPYNVSKENLIQFIEDKSLYGIYVALYEQYRDFKKKKRWGCKSTFMWREVETILSHHANPKFIHLIRDPRDVAVSAKKSIFSKGHPYNLALLWNHEQRNIEEYKKSALNDKNYLLVKYEDLTLNSRETLKKIMDFLNEEVEDQQFEFFKTDEASSLAKQSESWKNVQSPIVSDSVGQYKKTLSQKEQYYLEAVCGELMKKYHYSLNLNATKTEISFVEKLIINIEEELLFYKNEFKSLFFDKNFKKRWKKKILLMKLEWKYVGDKYV